MKHIGRVAIVVVLAVAVLGLSGCAGWFGPSIEGQWKAFSDYIFDMDGLVEIQDLTALVEGGGSRFEYTMTVPYPDGPSTALWYEASLSPAEPGEGDAFTMTVTGASDSEYSPPEGESFEGTVVFLDRDILVLDIDVGGGSPIMTWSFQRQ